MIPQASDVSGSSGTVKRRIGIGQVVDVLACTHVLPRNVLYLTAPQR